MLRIYRNFIEMPTFLKMITLLAIFAPMLVVASVVSGSDFWFFGAPISPNNWWTSGAGWCQIVFDFLMLTSAILFLARNKLARLIYIIGIFIFPLINSLTSLLAGADVSLSNINLIFVEIISFFIFLYMLLSKDVKNYIDEVSGEKQSIN